MKNKKSISLATVVDIQTLECLLYLVVNKSNKQIVSFLNKKKVSQSSIDNILENLEEDNEKLDGFFLRTPNGLRFLFLKEYKGSWDDLDVLSHELFHLVDFEANYRMFEKEPEFKAYLHGALFKTIRILLHKEVDKLNNMACKIKKKK